MNQCTHRQQIARGTFIAISVLVSLADAADLTNEKVRISPLVTGAASSARPNTSIQSTTASPAATQGEPKKAINQPAMAPGALQSLNPQPLPPAGRPGMEERAIIIVGGKQLTVGEFKKNMFAEIAAKAGPPKTIKSSARAHGFALPTPQNTMKGNIGGGGIASFSAKSDSLASLPGAGKSSRSVNTKAINYSELKCPDHGKAPPKISEVKGKLMPGKSVSVWGECFGERTGSVQIFGPFPGGKLNLPFVSWDQNIIELEIPNVQGATDSDGATLTVVTADGKTSTPMQVRFVAARARIEVPQHLWSPNANFELSSAEDIGITANKAYAGQLTKKLRINPQCALDIMDASVLSGNITAINGWEQGPPNEGAVTLDWVGTCTGTETSYERPLGFVKFATYTSACRVAFQTRAWAYCPVGIAP